MTGKPWISVNTLPWCLSKRVLPQHTDHAGVVWHGTYLAWLEEARVEALAAAGMDYAEMARQGIEMPVVSLKIDYRRSLRHGDVAVLQSICGPRDGVRWPWHTRMLRGEELIAESQVDLVMLSGGSRLIRRPPLELAALMDRLQRGPGHATNI